SSSPELQDPIIAASILAPHPLRVGVEQDSLPVSGEREVFHPEGDRIAGRDQLRRRQEDLLLSGSRIGSHEVTPPTIGSALESGVARVVQPTGWPEEIRRKVVRCEEPLES